MRNPAERGASPKLSAPLEQVDPHRPPVPPLAHACPRLGPPYDARGRVGGSARSGWRVNASQSVSRSIAPFRGRTPPDAAPTHHRREGEDT
ncbi:hypothetical protein GCM10023097_66390 [Streptomyces collinus]